MPRANYSQLYDRIERDFDITEITPDTIEAWLVQGKDGGKIKYGFDKKGKQRYADSKGISSAGRTNIRSFAEKVGVAGEIYEQIDKETEYSELAKLRNEAKDLDIYSKEVVDKAEVKMEIISKEMEEVSEERKIERIITAKQMKKLKSIEAKISSANAINTLYRLEGKLDDLEIDTTEARGLINERLAELEEEKEANIRRQEEAQERKAELRARGIIHLG